MSQSRPVFKGDFIRREAWSRAEVEMFVAVYDGLVITLDGLYPHAWSGGLDWVHADGTPVDWAGAA